jgi:hypothetical protein
MTTKLLALAIVAQLFATGAFAQSGTESGVTDPEDKTSAGDGEAMMGNTWSDSLGAAVFSDSTRKTVRSPAELQTQWTTLSAEDRDMLRRDCTAYAADSANGTAGAATGGISDTANTDGTTADAATMPGVTRDQMKEICATVGALE